MQDETTKKENGHEVSIALIQKDIQYMRESMTKIELTMSMIDKNFARKDELIQLEKLVGDTIKSWEVKQSENSKELDKKLELKAEGKDVFELKNTLSRINWLVITAVVVGLLSLVINTGS